MNHTTINTLEKLCYTNETAPKAFELIYKLATTENDLKHEASSTFVDLFQVVLAETSIDLDNRLVIIDKLIEEKELSKLIINAYERGLKAFGFIGHVHGLNDGLIEKQYKPSFDEIRIYQEEIIQRLENIALHDQGDLGILARESLYIRFSEQLHYGQSELMLSTIEELVNTTNKLDDNLRNILVEFSTNKAEVSGGIKNRIIQILDKFQPTEISDELRILVSEAPWLTEKVGDDYINISSKKAAELANHYFENGAEWLEFLPQLLKGEQRQTFYFAEAMAKNGFDKEIITNNLISCYKSIPSEQQNSVFVNGFVIGTNDNAFTRHLISELIAHPETEIHGIRQIRFLKPITKADLDFIRPLLEKNPDYLRNLEYLELTDFRDDNLIEVTLWLININYSFALQILHEILRKQDRWNNLKELVNKFLFVDHVFQLKSFINNSLHIEDLLKKSINDNPDEKRIYFLLDLIIKGYGDFNHDSILDRMLYFFIEEYWEVTWNYLGEYLANDTSRNFGLNMFLERMKLDNEKLFIWATTNPAKNSATAFQFMNIYLDNNDGDLVLDPFAKQMIDNYGNDEKLLGYFSTKLSNFSINTYSAENLLKRRKQLLEGLKNHQFQEVIDFAKKEIEYLDYRIEEERKFGENYELGR